MGMMKDFLFKVMEDMGESEITQGVIDRANDILAHKIEEAEGER